MKIISLNTWGGRAGKERLLEFLKERAEDTDVFCLQEVMQSDPYKRPKDPSKGEDLMTRGAQEISELLSGYTTFFHPHLLGSYGLMMLVKKDLVIKEQGDVFVYKHHGYIPEGDIGKHARNIQYATLETASGPFTVINFHGLWNGKGKTDTEDRLEQSRNILKFLQGLTGEFVLCGDFNLRPDTESIRLLEEAGLRNLIKEYGIISTRTSYYSKPEKFADYAFVSSGIRVKTFAVLSEEVSDHAALELKLEIEAEPIDA